MRRLRVLPLLSFLLVVCGGSPSQPLINELQKGAENPQAAVTELVEHINNADFSAATSLAIPNHAALASLSEGATFADVAAAIRSGDPGVTANFWAGFAQGAGSYLSSPISTSDGGIVEHGELTFHVVDVTPAQGGQRQMLLRDLDGFRIDLFASFGGGLADKMGPPVERLLSSRTDDARLILTELKEIVPSLEAAANRPEMSPIVVQEMIQLIELITRVT